MSDPTREIPEYCGALPTPLEGNYQLKIPDFLCNQNNLVNELREELRATQEQLRDALQAAENNKAAAEMRWISVDERLPKCDKTPNSFGVPVLIYPPYKEEGCSEMTQVFYGCRQTDKPNFYIFGRVIYGVENWQSLPQPPEKKHE